jgi:hypothetical protein
MNVSNKKTKGPTLMELFTTTGKPKFFFRQLEMFDVFTTGDTAHIDTIFKFLSHTRQHVHINEKVRFKASYTERFIMFSLITNVSNKKTKGPTLMELFTTTGKPKFFFRQLEMFDAFTTGDTAYIDTIFKFLPHTRQHVDACVVIPLR